MGGFFAGRRASDTRVHDFTDTAFRWEAQPAYDEPYEHEPMAAFCEVTPQT
ncbi:hypothetical protein [Alloactinosynnema sp. L-07]|nr:hypothetical protein [Alloactinosynnema sp. L-07]